jgi:hypothetical protein
MAERLVAAAEKGSPGDLARQLKLVAGHGALLPPSFYGALLLALQTITDKAEAES